MPLADYFLKIEGITGESLDASHEKEIEIRSFSFGATQAGSFATGSGGGSGKVQMQDFHFTMPLQKASPQLMKANATGQHIDNAILTCRKSGDDKQLEYLKIIFSHVLISSFQSNGSSDGDTLPVDQISFNFEKIEYQYKPQLASGQLGGVIKSYFDVKKMQGGT